MTTATEEQISPDTQLLNIVQANGLDANRGRLLIDALAPLVAKAGELTREAQAITVTDESQTDQMRAAGEKRKALMRVRTAAETIRKDQKADSLKMGRTIDSCCNWLKARIEPEEERLRQMEEFAERAEQAMITRRNADRRAALAPFVSDLALYSFDTLSDEQFAKLLDNCRVAFEAEKERKARAEADRIAGEQARAREVDAARVESERLASENARLTAERAAADRQAALERELAEAEAHEARQAAETERLRLQAIADKAEAERAAAQKVIDDQRAETARVEREALAERKRAEAAPDRDKLMALAVTVSTIKLPAVESVEAVGAVEAIRADLARVVERIKQHADRIGK